ncbi:MAG TPA: hypothetical protein VHQ64_00905 [Pyrinomonadaceae bacterium]|jgi:preprotein translocase subunit SecG|nr:hypothetical protein [Pyrinomonadaceae bacterium]
MPDYISNNLTAIVIALIGIFLGISIAIRIVVKKNKTDRSRRVIQKNNIVGGDQAGGDINKK